MGNDAMLELRNVTMNFGGVRALHRCSFYVKEGLITGLIGPNGAGKTTAFNIINGFLKPSSGKVYLEGKVITGKKPHLISRMGISRTFQMPRLFENLSIEDNLLLALKDPGEALSRAIFISRKPDTADIKSVKKVLKEVGLEKSVKTIASELSYGQKRLLEIARALLKEHDVLLLDEPTAGVNPKLRQELKALLRRLKKQGKTILLIEHDMEFVMDLSDEVIVLDAGSKLVADKPEKVRQNPKVLEAYLGK